MKTTLTLAAVLILSSLTWCQQSTTTVHNGNTGTDTTITCDGAVANSTCEIYDSSPSLLGTLKANRAQFKFCKAQHIKVFGKDHQRTPECEQAWSEHLAKEAK